MDFFDVHTHKKSATENVFSIENKYPNSSDFTKPFSIGIHPWFINELIIEEDLKFLEQKLSYKNCLAIGECGLDKLTKTDFNLQKRTFRKQIQLSEKYQKPLIIHCVKSFQEIIAFKKELKPKQVWIVHGFNKNLQLAQSLLKNNIILSFGKAIINNKKLEEVFKAMPITSILFETDNCQIDIQEIYGQASAIKKITLIKLQEHIKQNFNTIFSK
ncbi:TatD family hydrolase [uncultured Polaribacter sp.]|uniref:TatD family hydrolase n=1 Tax=uncultured Polaribacter sp. TaxID=174711 RepID=UPI00260D979D|nr:TatD family hydrolase [uncultured Polaribacter sp.]